MEAAAAFVGISRPTPAHPSILAVIVPAEVKFSLPAAQHET